MQAPNEGQFGSRAFVLFSEVFFRGGALGAVAQLDGLYSLFLDFTELGVV